MDKTYKTIASWLKRNKVDYETQQLASGKPTIYTPANKAVRNYIKRYHPGVIIKYEGNYSHIQIII